MKCKNTIVLAGANDVYVAVVNGKIHEHGPGAAIQPGVIFEAFNNIFGFQFIFWKIEIISPGSVVRDFAFVVHALGGRIV